MICNQICGQVDTKFDPHRRAKINGKRKLGGLNRPVYEDDILKTEADSQNKRAIHSFQPEGAASKTSLPFLQKVDTFPFSRRYVGKECLCLSSFEDRINQSDEDTESIRCSVASNGSIHASNCKLHSDIKNSNRHVVNGPFDDSHSSCEFPNGRKTDFLNEKHIAAKRHNLEICAYRKTMRAFYASGCLTWEQEALLTDLRLTLHISHDEHLSELTHLRRAQAV